MLNPLCERGTCPKLLLSGNQDETRGWDGTVSASRRSLVDGRKNPEPVAADRELPSGQQGGGGRALQAACRAVAAVDIRLALIGFCWLTASPAFLGFDQLGFGVEFFRQIAERLPRIRFPRGARQLAALLRPRAESFGSFAHSAKINNR